MPASLDGSALILSKLSYVDENPFLTVWLVIYVEKLVRKAPFFLQMTVIAGEPVEIQLRVSADSLSNTSSRELIWGKAEEKVKEYYC